MSKNFKNFNIKKFNLKNKKNLYILKKIFEKMSLIRSFELEAYKNKKNNKFNTLIYLSLGQESIYATISEVMKNVSIFGQHRGHGIYLAYGGEPKKLVDELIGLESGTNKGMGGSPPIFDTKIGMYGHVGLIGDQVPVAAGYSLIMKNKKVVCVNIIKSVKSYYRESDQIKSCNENVLIIKTFLNQIKLIILQINLSNLYLLQVKI